MSPLPGVSAIAAIARSIERAACLRDVADQVVELCDGEASRRAGPWTLALPLDRHGLGGTVLQLHLSHDALSLRFDCDGVGARDVLSSRIDELKCDLQHRLDPPLQVSVELAVS